MTPLLAGNPGAAARTKIFCVCRMPNRPSKLAHVNFRPYLLNLPPRPD